MNNNHNHSDSRLLKILITIGIIAILISVCIKPVHIKYIRPVYIKLINLYIYTVELLKVKKDQPRVQNLSSINFALNELQNINSSLYLGESNKVYISLPSSDMKCGDLELPSLPNDWEYRCKSKTDYRRIDGNGWIPVDFTQLPKDLDFKSNLPIDPANTADSGYYYAYVVGENDWILTSLLELDKYLKETALKDNGTDPTRLEVGSNLQLWARARGLVGYWKFDEEQGTSATDSSGQGNTGTLVNSPTWVDDQFRKALSFDGVDDYVKINDNTNLNTGNYFTFAEWYKYTSINAGSNYFYNRNTQSGGTGFHLIYLTGSSGSINYQYANGIDVIVKSSNTLSWSTGQWYFITITHDNIAKTINFYRDGINVGTATYTDNALNVISRNAYFGGYQDHNSFNGTIDEVRIYNRALSEKQIHAIYNATK